jgi:serine O-acetyltransferase
MFTRIRSYARAIQARDPACRSVWDVVFSYPGFHAIAIHRIAHPLWRAGWHWLARWVSQWGRFITGIEIHPGAVIGHHVFIDHGMGVVIGETAEVGDGCTIYQGVTLGGTSLDRGVKRHPTLGQGVIVGAGSQVLGSFTVGDGARIGSSAVVTRAVPAGATAVGNPARIVGEEDHDVAQRQPAPRTAFSAYGVTPDEDPVSHVLRNLTDGAASQADQIALLWRAVNALTGRPEDAGDAPDDAAREDAQAPHGQ